MRCRSHKAKVEWKRFNRLSRALDKAMKWVEENCLVSSTTIMSDGNGGFQIEHYENKDLLRDTGIIGK